MTAASRCTALPLPLLVASMASSGWVTMAATGARAYRYCWRFPPLLLRGGIPPPGVPTARTTWVPAVAASGVAAVAAGGRVCELPPSERYAYRRDRDGRLATRPSPARGGYPVGVRVGRLSSRSRWWRLHPLPVARGGTVAALWLCGETIRCCEGGGTWVGSVGSDLRRRPLLLPLAVWGRTGAALRWCGGAHRCGGGGACGCNQRGGAVT